MPGGPESPSPGGGKEWQCYHEKCYHENVFEGQKGNVAIALS